MIWRPASSIADMARRLFSERAAKAAFLLAALCPFLANYAAAALTETLEIFFTALAFDLGFRGIEYWRNRRGDAHAIMARGCGLSVGGAILLRPDGGILLAAIGGYLFVAACAQTSLDRAATQPALNASADHFGQEYLSPIGAAAPLVPWTLRNLHTLHRFEPLAPRYANDSDEPLMTGFNRWVKTWIADYVSVQEIYWNVPGEDIDATRLPRRAFDSPQQRGNYDCTLRRLQPRPRHDPRTRRPLRCAGARTHSCRSHFATTYGCQRCASPTCGCVRERNYFHPIPAGGSSTTTAAGSTVSLVFGLINLAYIVLWLPPVWHAPAQFLASAYSFYF